jgi:hypothetical protein
VSLTKKTDGNTLAVAVWAQVVEANLSNDPPREAVEQLRRALREESELWREFGDLVGAAMGAAVAAAGYTALER